MIINIVITFFVLKSAHVPKIPEDILSHGVFQEELLEMADKSSILKHLKQQVIGWNMIFCVCSICFIVLLVEPFSFLVSISLMPPC